MNTYNASLKLFNAIQIKSELNHSYNRIDFFRMISNGYILDQRISHSPQVFDSVEDRVGIGGRKLNATFHKSWAKVANASMGQLVSEQIMHYITTYGFESLGFYDEGLVYIPSEELKIPDIDDIPLVFIKAFTADDILDGIVALGSSGIALSQDVLDSIMVLIEDNDYDYEFISEITNRELHTLLCEFYDFVPTDPVGFLRHLVLKLTDESLLIKNRKLISMIKLSNGNVLDEYLKFAPDNLASIFHRYKPLFLAMKSISKNKTFFNQLRKKANYMHEPLSPDYLNTVTAQIKNTSLSIRDFDVALSKYSVWRKIRLANALNSRLTAGESIVYKIRNGKSWVADFNWDKDDKAQVEYVLAETLDSIASDIYHNVSGRTFYIPSNVHYAIPATQKQFVGNIPSNSYVSVDDDLLVGVHWCNKEGNRIDIDLSLVDINGKYGWDSVWRSRDRSVLFSGDLTTAPYPNGASEFHYLGGEFGAKFIIANYFNFSANITTELQFIVGNEDRNNKGGFLKNSDGYVINQNKVVASQIVPIDKQETILGMAIIVEGEKRVYFTQASMSEARSSRLNGNTIKALNFFVENCVNSLSLEDLIDLAGGTIIRSIPVPDDGVEYVDLSLEALDKTTIIDLLTVRDV